MGGYAGWEHYTPPARGVPPSKRRAKYNATPTAIDGHTFASQREAARYQQLKAEQQAGAISGLELQPTFPLRVVRPDGITVEIGRYVADFRYQREGQTVIEDAKGMKTTVYQWKKKHVEAQYAITVVEV